MRDGDRLSDDHRPGFSRAQGLGFGGARLRGAADGHAEPDAGGFHVATGFARDLREAARNVDLRIGEVVDAPNWVVTAFWRVLMQKLRKSVNLREGQMVGVKVQPLEFVPTLSPELREAFDVEFRCSEATLEYLATH